MACLGIFLGGWGFFLKAIFTAFLKFPKINFLTKLTIIDHFLNYSSDGEL